MLDMKRPFDETEDFPPWLTVPGGQIAAKGHRRRTCRPGSALGPRSLLRAPSAVQKARMGPFASLGGAPCPMIR